MNLQLHHPQQGPVMETIELELPRNHNHFEFDYTLLKPLGYGTYGEVYLAQDLSGKDYAVKIMMKSNHSEDSIQSFRNEVALLHILNHPNIVRFHDFYEEPDKLYLVMEYMTGGDVFDEIIRLNNYTELTARELIRQILSAIELFHRLNIVHRDMKMENLLLSKLNEQLVVKVADFGIAEYLSPTCSGITEEAGSPAYMAPEIYRGEPYGKPVDMWGLGVISFALLCGDLPFGSDPRRCVPLILAGNFSMIPEFWANVSYYAKNFVQKLLVSDPKKRLTVEQALQHPWFSASKESLEKKLCVPATVSILRMAKRWRKKTMEKRKQRNSFTAGDISAPCSEAKDRSSSDEEVGRELSIELGDATSTLPPPPSLPLFILTSSEGNVYNVMSTITVNYFTTTYEAVNMETGEEVFVLAHDTSRLSPQSYQLIQNELSILNTDAFSTSPKHLLQLYDVIYKENYCYVVQEKLYGKGLLDGVAERLHFNEEDSKALFSQLVEAIAALHEENISPKSVSLDNFVFVSDSENADLKLVNFRLAKQLVESTPTKSTTAMTAFTPPESMNLTSLYNKVEKAGDIWSLGVIFHFLLTGKYPYPQDKQEDLKKALIEDREIELQDENGWRGISSDGKDLVTRMLRKNPLERLTIQQVKQHAWFTKKPSVAIKKTRRVTWSDENEVTLIDSNDEQERDEETIIESVEMVDPLKALRRERVRRKFLKVIHGVIFIARAKKCLEGSRFQDITHLITAEELINANLAANQTESAHRGSLFSMASRIFGRNRSQVPVNTPPSAQSTSWMSSVLTRFFIPSKK